MNDKKQKRATPFRLPAIVVAAFICLLLILPHAAAPALYTPKMDAETDLHDRVSVLRQATQDNSGTILPLMEDIFSSSSTLVLNLELKDFSSAERDLDRYLAQSRQFDNMVIKLDMSQSDLDEWKRLNAQNKEELLELFNDTRRFSELQRLEIEYRDADNPDMLYSVMYEGEALKSKIKETVALYEERSGEMIAVSQKFEVKTDAYEQSVEDARDVAASVEEEQEERSALIQREVAPRSDLRITLGLEPSGVRYGESLNISGSITGTDQRVVSLYLDSRIYKNLTAAADGTFLHREQIKKIRTGMHTLYATSDGRFSEVRSFRVLSRDTTLSLTQSGSTNVSGRLLADDIPVSGAPIRILSAGRQIATPKTSTDGSYTADLKLAEGEHHITAIFDDTTYPLLRAESEEILIVVDPPKEGRGLEDYIALFLGVVLLLFAGAGGIWYLRRRSVSSRETIPVIGDPPEILAESIEETEEETPPIPEEFDASTETALSTYHALEDSDYPAALRSLFLGLAKETGIDDPLRATAGDIRQRRPGDTDLHAWLAAYELVLYGGQIPAAGKRQWFVDTYQSLREDHV